MDDVCLRSCDSSRSECLWPAESLRTHGGLLTWDSENEWIYYTLMTHCWRQSSTHTPLCMQKIRMKETKLVNGHCLLPKLFFYFVAVLFIKVRIFFFFYTVAVNPGNVIFVLLFCWHSGLCSWMLLYSTWSLDFNNRYTFTGKS